MRPLAIATLLALVGAAPAAAAPAAAVGDLISGPLPGAQLAPPAQPLPPPGAPTVLICGRPAATAASPVLVTTQVMQPVGPGGSLAPVPATATLAWTRSSPTVLIAGAPAVRSGDTLNGTVTVAAGCRTVTIGP